MDLCVAAISDSDKINLTVKVGFLSPALEELVSVPSLSLTQVFAMHALHNIISTTAGRTEYFNIVGVTEVGDGRHIAIETFITARIMIFIKYLTKIHIEMNDPSQNRTSTSIVRRPTRRSADLVEQTFIVSLSLLIRVTDH
jgi:hypothetical protein